MTEKWMTDEDLFQRLQGQRFEGFRDLVEAVSKEAYKNISRFRIPAQFDFRRYVDWAIEQGWVKVVPHEYYEVVGTQVPVASQADD